MTEAQAIALFDSKWWEDHDARTIATFQLGEKRLCMPFSEFQRALSAVLGRPVWTHEFANRHALLAEMYGGKPPTMSEIADLIPAEKRVVVAVGR